MKTAVKARRAHATAAEDRISVWQKLAYGSGNAANNFAVNAPKALVPPVFQMTLGLNPALVGIALAVPRLWDAFTDPLMGMISDNTRSRWGRRRPWVFAGAILAGLSFAGFWWVPAGLSGWMLFAFLLGMLLLLYTCTTVYAVPWYSMLPEMSPDYHERTRVAAFSSFMNKLSGIAVQWTFAFTQLTIFSSTLVGARALGLVGGVAIICIGIIPAIFCRERFYKVAQDQLKISILKALREALSNREFIKVASIQLFMLLGLMMTNSLGMYVVVYYAFDGDMASGSVLTGWVGTANHLMGAAALPVMAWLSTKIGKRGALGVSLGMALIGMLSYWFLLTPEHPYVFLLSTIFYGPGLTSPFMLIPSMLADVIDKDELDSGLRREALYSSVFHWINKVGVSLAFFMSGMVIAWSGFDEKLGGAQDEATFTSMRLMLALIPAASLSAGFFFLKRYRIDEDMAYEIREKLEARRGKV